ENLTVTLGTPTNATLGATTAQTITIVDNDAAPTVQFSLASQSVNENVGSVTLLVTQSAVSGLSVSVPFTLGGSASSGSDYTLTASPLTIPAGQTSAAITLTVVDDLLDELDENLTVTLGTPTNATLGATTAQTITIVDNDAAPTVQFRLARQNVNENVGSVTLLVTQSAVSGLSVSVPFTLGGSASSGSDYTLTASPLTIPAGQTSAAITLTVVDDAVAEGSENLTVTLGTPTNATLGATTAQTITIVDNDAAPQLTLSLQSSPLAENGGVARVVAALSSVATQTVTVTLGFSGTATKNTDYSAGSNTITVLAGQISGTVFLTALDDLLFEGSESIIVDVTEVINGTENGTQSVTVTITDDNSDPFQLIGNVLNVFGTAGNDVVSMQYGIAPSVTVTINGANQTFAPATINIDTLGGNDSLNATLSSLDDTALLNGLGGSITSSNYAISYANVETTVLNGGASDQVTYNDPGVVNTAYLLPVYGILQGGGFSNQAIAFGNHTVNAAGNDDNLFIYGDTGVQAYVSTPTQALMLVGSQLLLGNNFKRVYAYGMGGNDTATYSGSASDETMTALWNYVFVNTSTTVQYFDSFKTLTVAGNGGLDIAVMYDSPGVDTFTASDTSFRYTRSGVFTNIANGYDRVYAFNYFGGFDTATLNGSSGNDKLSSINNYSVLVTPTTLQQATGFRTVIVNAGTGTDTATLQDSAGNDTLNAFAGTAELIYANGRTARAIGFDTVNANGSLGGANRKNISTTNPLTYQLKFKGTWV
ncbi:MAG: hypothetical protein JNM18_22730, partial [Planctomycetaceae bacterium]|nr:hypothetical protein [Planctomycetaceae bacterium]